MLKALDDVMVEDTAGDPISGLKWTHKSLRNIQTALDKEGYPKHRMFNLISANWAGEPLDSHETILNHIHTTTSTTGFWCQSQLDTTEHELKQKVSDKDFAGLRVRPHKRFPQWNYTIYPRIPKPVI